MDGIDCRIGTPGQVGYWTTKHAFDIVVALTLAAAFLPLMICVGLLIGLTSPGPVITRQTRCGQGGRPFKIYKFRTMEANAEGVLLDDERLCTNFATAWKLPNDPRITPVGAVLRRTSIDELPQLINVLRGEMSIVGPRPVQPTELAKFGQWATTVTSVRPGITGLWQTSGRSLLSYDQRVALEVRYVQCHGFWFDIGLILRTIPVVASGRGAM